MSLSQSKAPSDSFGIEPGMVDYLDPRSVGIRFGAGDACLPAYPGARADGRPFASHSGLIVARPPHFPPPGHGCVVDCLVGVPPEPGLVAELDKAASTQPEGDTRDPSKIAQECVEAAIVHGDVAAATVALLDLPSSQEALNVASRAAIRVIPFYPSRLLHGVVFVLLLARRGISMVPGDRRKYLSWVACALCEAGCGTDGDVRNGVGELCKHMNTTDRHPEQHAAAMRALRELDIPAELSGEEFRLLQGLRSHLFAGIVPARVSVRSTRSEVDAETGDVRALPHSQRKTAPIPQYSLDDMPPREAHEQRPGADDRVSVDALRPFEKLVNFPRRAELSPSERSHARMVPGTHGAYDFAMRDCWCRQVTRFGHATRLQLRPKYIPALEPAVGRPPLRVGGHVADEIANSERWQTARCDGPNAAQLLLSLLEDGIRGGLVLGAYAPLITPPASRREGGVAAGKTLDRIALRHGIKGLASSLSSSSGLGTLPVSLGEVHRYTKQVTLALADSQRWDVSVRAPGFHPLRYLTFLAHSLANGKHPLHGDARIRGGLKDCWDALI